MRRRRKQRYTWFPTNPTLGAEATVGSVGVNYFDDIWVGNSVQLGEPFATDVQFTEPLLLDDTPQAGIVQPETPQWTLRDLVEGQSYVTERIVGKIWVSRTQDAGETVTDVPLIIGVGIAVLPTDDATGTADLANIDLDPLLQQNSGNPWMWRRTWILGQNGTAGLDPEFPASNWQMGSVADGPHVDVKSKRRVSREQRLFIICSVGTMGLAIAGGDSATGHFGYDLRILGAMRRARNTSSFK